MDEDVFNMEVRRFLKQVGATSQRQIERAVQNAIATGAPNVSVRPRTRVRIKIDSIGLDHEIEAEIALS